MRPILLVRGCHYVRTNPKVVGVVRHFSPNFRNRSETWWNEGFPSELMICSSISLTRGSFGEMFLVARMDFTFTIPVDSLCENFICCSSPRDTRAWTALLHVFKSGKP